MFSLIFDEILKASDDLSREKLLELAPVYLLDNSERISSDIINDAGDHLIEQLELTDFFDVLHDAFVQLGVVQQYKMSEKTQFDIGLNDSFDNFAYSLSEWINLLAIKDQIQKGIILINVDDYNALEENGAWWNSLLRTVRYYKSSYIFIFATENENDKKKLAKEISRYHNCVFLPEYKMDEGLLCSIFSNKIQSAGFSLSESAIQAVKDAIKGEEKNITPNIIAIWAQKTAWEFAVSDKSNNKVLTDEDINMSFIRDNIGSHDSDGERSMGFKA